MLEFTRVENDAVAVKPNGLKIIAHAVALNIGVATAIPLSKEDAGVKIYTTLQECNIEGEPVESYAVDNSLTINCSRSDLPNADVESAEFRDFYIDRLIAMTTTKTA